MVIHIIILISELADRSILPLQKPAVPDPRTLNPDPSNQMSGTSIVPCTDLL